MRYLDLLKKTIILVISALCIVIVYIGPSGAATLSENYLAQIAQNTYNILSFIQNPQNFAGLAASLMTQDTDDSSIIMKTQGDFAKLGSNFTSTPALAMQLSPRLTADIVNRPLADFGGKDPKILLDIPDINNISYGSLLGSSPVPSSPFDAYEFIKIASAANTIHPVPTATWEGNKDAIAKYKSFFNTVAAVESFDSYVLSKLTFSTSLKNNDTINNLVNTASNSEWIAKIATEELGPILREILLFQSQNLIINVQIEDHLRDLVNLQVMTNSLLIKTGALNELQLINDAKGKNIGANY
ncbi:MAG TPA: hypothetical protein VL360_03695 [Gammaproteobacteria bacterium]|jgi:hypothetical protein|nr:hypothetical protein [Gammaproteobacteria bacterium]